MKLEIALLNIPKVGPVAPAITGNAVTLKENLLAESALVGRVQTGEENSNAIKLMQGLKELSCAIERARKKESDPFLDAQRAIKRAADLFVLELDKEYGRLELLTKDFALEERRRALEAEQARQREIERIEAERQAELKRIADEQAAKERAAREAQAAAERAAREAKTTADREAARIAAEAAAVAEAARKESEAKAAREAQRVQETANVLTALESKTVEVARAAGQVTREEWVIDRINDFQLLKARPDLVRKIEWDLVGLKQALRDNGGKLPGVVAHEDLQINVRNTRKIVDVVATVQ